ncbi:MAG TPA: 2OG-Fe(II) oxygenase [Candidatus Binatia bacterium]
MNATARVRRYDWEAVRGSLDADGSARLPGLLTARECAALRATYRRDDAFRSTVAMARHNFGRGEYRYFRAPLPPLVAALRAALYQPLAVTARAWAARLRRDPAEFPRTLDGFLARCHAASQRRPTPLLLRYTAGDWNALHQDLYGAIAFPLQVLVVLSERDVDYAGGEVLLVEQRPRAQSRATAFSLARGEGLIFTNRERPVRGTRGDYRVAMRHGVSVLTRGERLTLGLIFHDAQ